MQTWQRLAGLAVIAALAGCAANGAPMSATPERPPFQSSPASPGPTGGPAEVPASHWQGIVDDLAARGVTATATLVSAERVTWSTGALGCPKPGAAYTQALVEGMRVIVSAGGASYDYRFGAGDKATLCEK